MDHIIKEFIDFRMPIASLEAKVVLWGPIQGTITSEIEMKRINSLVLFYYFSDVRVLNSVDDSSALK